MLHDLQRLKGLLAHNHPNLSLGEWVGNDLTELDPAQQKQAVAPEQVKSRSEARYRLEIDYMEGLAGGDDLENLRLLCKQHNLWAASQRVGREN